MDSLEKYAADRRQRQLWMTRIFAFLGIVSFGGTAVMGIVAMFRSGLQPPKIPPAVTAAQSTLAQLNTEKQNYEVVLKREPDNRTALEGLVQLQIKLQDLPGAKANLEKLIKLDPANVDYKLVLTEVNKRLGK